MRCREKTIWGRFPAKRKYCLHSYPCLRRNTYDVEIPEIIKTFMEYDQQTEDMRTITVVSNPGTEQEKTESVLSPKGLIVGLSPEAAYADRTFTLYTDVACTQPLEEAPDVNADVTVYIKWDE